MIDVERARAETPGCRNVTHFNNAGASLLPSPVYDAVMRHLETEAQIGGYEAEAQAHDQAEHAYDALARLLNCRRQEVAIVENATRAWDMLFYAIPLQPGDRILTAQCEYGSNFIAMLQRAQQTGAVIETVPNDATGQLSIDALKHMLDARVRLIAITHVPTNGGLVNPAQEVGAVAREAGILYLLDACQSAGQMPLDVEALGCDMLTATGRKFLRGPRATGFLYARQDVLERLEPPFLDMQAASWVAADRYQIRDDARRFETWETSVAGKIGLGVAVDYALAWGLDDIQERVIMLANRLRDSLHSVPGVVVQDQGRRQCGIVTFTVADTPAQAIKARLAAHCINVWTSPLSSTRLDMEARGLTEVVRASVHYYNTEAEIARLCAALQDKSRLSS